LPPAGTGASTSPRNTTAAPARRQKKKKRGSEIEQAGTATRSPTPRFSVGASFEMGFVGYGEQIRGQLPARSFCSSGPELPWRPYESVHVDSRRWWHQAPWQEIHRSFERNFGIGYGVLENPGCQTWVSLQPTDCGPVGFFHSDRSSTLPEIPLSPC